MRSAKRQRETQRETQRERQRERQRDRQRQTETVTPSRLVFLAQCHAPPLATNTALLCSVLL